MAKIQLDVEIENDESKAKMELDFPYESDETEVVEAAERLKKAHDTISLLTTLHNILVPGTALYDHFLDMFCWNAHDKAGWHSAQVYIKSVSVDGVRQDIDGEALLRTDKSDRSCIQLSRSSLCPSCYDQRDRSMHFLS